MAKKTVQRVNVNLPLELIMEILLRLPVKTLLPFRSVCKSWLSLISNNNFATSHFEHAATHRRFFVRRYDLQPPISIDVDTSLHDDSAYASLTLDFFRSQTCLEIGGSCRGFLALHNDTHIYLLNPSTGLIKQIPLKNFEFLSGFAYDQSTDDYLIVSVFRNFHRNHHRNHRETSSIKLKIFSLRANKWKPVEVSPHLPYNYKRTFVSECTPKYGLFLNGSIHWMVYNDDTSKNVIFAFDLKEMTLSEIPLPDDFIFSYRNNFSIYYDYYDLLDVEGLLGAWVKDLNTVKIWVMQKYGVHSSWTKIIQFSVDPVLHNHFEIVCLTKCGDIVGKNNEGELMKFNNKGQLLEYLLLDMADLVVFIESMFSLPGNGQV